MDRRNFLFLILIIVIILFFLFKKNPDIENENAIIIWHWMTDRHEVLQELAENYKKETGKSVVFELNAPSELYATKVRAAAQTKTLPDVFGVLGEANNMSKFIQSGLIFNLLPYMEMNNGEWKSSFYEKALEMNSFKEGNMWNIPKGIYGVPIDVTNIQMLYNKRIFKEAGINVIPTTWEEFIQAGEMVIKNTDKQFFVSGFGEVWLINSMVRNFAYNLMGEEKYIQTLKGIASYNDPDWIQVFEKFKEMSDKNLFASGVVSMVNKTAERIFSTEKAAVTFNGSWCVNVYKGMAPFLEYGAMFFPKISDNYPVVVQGGAGSSFVVNQDSPRKAEVIEFLKWLTNKKNQIFLSEKTNNLPSNKFSVGQMTEILNGFAKGMDHTSHPTLLPVYEDPSIEEAIGRGVQSIIIGETSPEQLVKDIDLQKKKLS